MNRRPGRALRARTAADRTRPAGRARARVREAEAHDRADADGSVRLLHKVVQQRVGGVVLMLHAAVQHADRQQRACARAPRLARPACGAASPAPACTGVRRSAGRAAGGRPHVRRVKSMSWHKTALARAGRPGKQVGAARRRGLAQTASRAPPRGRAARARGRTGRAPATTCGSLEYRNLSICGSPPSTSHSAMRPSDAAAAVLPWSLFLKIQCTAPGSSSLAPDLPRRTSLPRAAPRGQPRGQRGSVCRRQPASRCPGAASPPQNLQSPARGHAAATCPALSAEQRSPLLPPGGSTARAPAPHPKRLLSPCHGRQALSGGLQSAAPQGASTRHELVGAEPRVDKRVDERGRQVLPRRVHRGAGRRAALHQVHLVHLPPRARRPLAARPHCRGRLHAHPCATMHHHAPLCA